VRITLVTFFDVLMAEVGELTSAVLRDYAAHNGYSFVCQKGIIDSTRGVMWNKISVVQRVLCEDSCDWLMWIDADALVVNPSVKIESLIAQVPEGRAAAFATDDNGLCAGVFLLRSCDWSKAFLDTLYFLGDINCEDEYGHGLRAEQNCIKGLMKHFRSVADRIHLFEQNVMNAYEHTRQSGDFILHLSSFSNEERVAKLRRLLGR
jgi:hypothetical protein